MWNLGKYPWVDFGPLSNMTSDRLWHLYRHRRLHDDDRGARDDNDKIVDDRRGLRLVLPDVGRVRHGTAVRGEFHVAGR